MKSIVKDQPSFKTTFSESFPFRFLYRSFHFLLPINFFKLLENCQTSHNTVRENISQKATQQFFQCSIKLSISNSIGSALRKFASFCHFTALNSNPSWTSGDMTPLKINFEHAPLCLTCAIPACESFTTGHCHWQLQNFNETGLGMCFVVVFFNSVMSGGPLWEYTSRPKNFVNFPRAQPTGYRNTVTEQKKMPFGQLKNIFSYSDIWSLPVFTDFDKFDGQGEMIYKGIPDQGTWS